MTGIGVSHGAVSVINAIPNGIGSTIGIELETRAVFEPAESGKEVVIVDRPGMSSLLAETCVRRTLERIGEDPETAYRLTITSEIPPSRGLKSSSSTCNAVISSVLDHFGKKMDELDMVRLGVECAKECKVTITGAFDDACGCQLGGLVVTRNADCELLSRKEMPAYDVVICIPDREIPKNKVDVSRYRERREEYDLLSERVEKDPLGVLTDNGRMVAGIIGMDDSVVAKAMELGALSAGVTGTGPAVAVICAPGTGKTVADGLGCRTILSKVR